MSLYDRWTAFCWPPSGSDRDFWAQAGLLQRAWAMKCLYGLLLLFGVTFMSGLESSAILLYGGALGMLANAAPIVYYEALANGYRREDSDAASKALAAEAEAREATKDAARMTLLSNETTYTSQALRALIIIKYPGHGFTPTSAQSGTSILGADASRIQRIYEQVGIPSHQLPPKIVEALQRGGRPILDGSSLSGKQKHVIDRYLDTCLRIEDFITADVSAKVKAEAYARIEELAAATAIELQMLGDLKRDEADIRLQNWLAGIVWYDQ